MTEVKVQLFFTVILTVSGKKEPVKRIMSIYVTSVPKAAHFADLDDEKIIAYDESQ